MDGSLDFISRSLQIISGVRVLSPGYDPTLQYDISIDKDGNTKDIILHAPKPHAQIADTGENVLDARNDLIAPSLCHAHIHLDKCFLLSDPKFEDLEIVRGDFAEAMELTSKAKQRFERDDLLRRGKWLIGESVATGVTHIRAFVEVDHAVDFKCLDAAIELKHLFAKACEIQICVFAQDPIYSGPHGENNRNFMDKAVRREEVEVVGSTPYVEDSQQHMHMNLEWASRTAMDLNKHLDLHLDYNLDPEQMPLLRYVTRLLTDLQWFRNGKIENRKTVALGHCTRLTLFSAKEWSEIRDIAEEIPLYFVGLPNSDLFIQGKPSPDEGGGKRFRGTLQIPQMIQKYNIPGCISINNVGNAFTPHGSCDPLSIASMGVGVYHAGTKQDAQLLYECVSTRAKEAIGYSHNSFAKGETANFVLFDIAGAGESQLSKQRGRRTLQEIVNDPPKVRKTIFRGRLVMI